MATPGNRRTVQPAVKPELAPYTPEFRLMLACLRWPLGPAEIDRIVAVAGPATIWSHLLELSQRHRVVGLVWRALKQAGCELPAGVARAFQASAAAAARQALSLSVECIRLSEHLKGRGIDALFLKGITVTVLAYGDPAVRHAKDIDLLVAPESVESVVAFLRDSGYVPAFDLDSVPEARRRLWFRYTKSMDWVHPGRGILLELHWRLTDAPLLAGRLAQGTRQSVAIMPGRYVDTLETEHLLAYLCVHGAAHGWMRLKWLADVYALLPHEARRCESVYRRLIDLGAERSAGQALLLCHVFFDLPLTTRLEQELNASRSLRLLRRATLRLLARGGERTEVDDLPFGTTSVYLSRMMVGSSLRALVSEWRTWAYRPDELLRSRLPQPLFFLFPLFRLQGWLMHRVRHGGKSVPSAHA